VSAETHNLRGQDQSILTFVLGAVIRRGWRYAPGGHDGAYLEAIIDQILRPTWR